MARVLAVVVAVVLAATTADALTLLTVGKRAAFRLRGGVASARVTIGADPEIRAIMDVSCAGGVVVALQVASYGATARVDAQPVVTLPCTGWRKTSRGFRYRDRTGRAGGVRRIEYGRSGFTVEIAGGDYRHVAGPVGYVELWIDVGTMRFLARFHDFRRNDAERIVTRVPSAAAATGEAIFWEVLHGLDHSPAHQDLGLATLEKAVRQRARDGRSRFLLAMMHLYRFGQATTRFDQVSDAARAELAAANDAFAVAVPLLWNGHGGDSRVPGFAAGAKFALGHTTGDAGLEAQGLADLETAIDINAFFNVFDLIPVSQAVAPTDPRYATVLARLNAYLSDPDTLACVVTQPEICSDAGLAPRNSVGALLLFGDLYAKGAALDPGNVAAAEAWYSLAKLLDRPGYAFQAALDARAGHAQERADLYADADPSNDPPIIGAGPEACAVCHYE